MLRRLLAVAGPAVVTWAPAAAQPAIDAALGSRLPDGTSLRLLEDYKVPDGVVAPERLEAFQARAIAGVTAAVTALEPGALCEHVGGWKRVWMVAAKAAKAVPGGIAPPERMVPHLTQLAEQAWREGRPGTALLVWLARDRFLMDLSEPVMQVDPVAAFGAQRLGEPADDRMLAYVGGRYRIIDPKITEKTSLRLW